METNMHLGNRPSAELLAIIEQYNLLNHPFYQDWVAGKLTKNRLASYAAEWGAFILLIPAAWRTLGYDRYVAEEMEHAKLWKNDFAGALNVEHLKASNPKVLELIDLAKQKFSSPHAALGALFAFEAQQPATSKSKLEGLAQYKLGDAANTYFEVHQDDYNEPELLANTFDGMSSLQQQTALAACRQLCKAMWDALTGIHGNAAMATG